MDIMTIKWVKDKTEEEPVYKLYVYTTNNLKQLIGYLGWSDFMNSWIFSYQIPPIEHKCKKYTNYTINEIEDVFFRAILDIQADLSRINNMCVNYCNAISDYIIDYITGVEQNEN
jgi:hypothetical protein